jgi:amidase
MDAAYTEAINLLNYSAAVIPVTKADRNIDVVDHTYQPIGDEDRKNWIACRIEPLKPDLRVS